MDPARVVRLAHLPKQAGFLRSVAPEVLYSGAWGAGKSRALCTKVLLLAVRYPGTTIGLCRQKLNALRATTLQTLLEEVCPPELIVGHHKSDRVLTVRAGPDGKQTSRIHYFGLVNESGESYNIRSLNLGACGVDEAVEISEREWEEIGGRLRDSHCGLHQLFGATNPAGKGHWLYQRGWVERRHKMEVIETNALENPYLPADYVERIQRLRGRYRDRYVLGKWVDFEGLVYDHFDPLVHCLTWDEFFARHPGGRDRERARGGIPLDWTRIGSIDFGYTNPFVHQWWAISPDGEWYRYRELYHTRRIVTDHGERILSLERAADEPAPQPRYADHDAEDRATLDRIGIPTAMANKEKSPGIQAVYDMLTVNPMTGRPRMFFLRDVLVEEDPFLVSQGLPTCTEHEIMAYAYPQGQDGKPVKEEPVKVNDHGCDATRYAAYSHLHGYGSGIVQGTIRPDAAPPVRFPRALVR